MRLIDADSLDKALTSLRYTADGKLAHWGNRKDWCLRGNEIEMLIATAPTVEVEPIRHGKWVKRNSWYFCSKCGTEMFFTGTYDEGQRYCYNCGAKMDEVSE